MVMSEFKAHKVVSSLPSTLEPDTIYLVRVGVGFDLYCSDATGSIAHSLNSLSTDFIIDGGSYSSENDYTLNVDLGGV